MIFHNKIRLMTFALGFLLLTAGNAAPQKGPKRSLLVASCDTAENCKQRVLHRFVFENGKMTSQDILATFSVDKTHFDWGMSLIDNRYVVSGAGEVFDIHTKILHARKVGILVAHEEGKIFINPILATIKTIRKDFDISLITPAVLSKAATASSKQAETFVFDLATKKYGSIRRPNFFTHHVDGMSPDNSRVFDIDSFTHRATVRLRKGKGLGDFSTDTVDGTFRASCGKNCKEKFERVPSLWVDSDRFLTQRKNGELVIYDFRDKKWQGLEPISLPSELPHMPTLYADAERNIFYKADKIYRLDIESGKATVTNEHGLGNGFKLIWEGDLKSYLFHDKKLGTFVSGNSTAIDNYLASDYYEGPLFETAPIGVAVWSPLSESWTRIKIDHHAKIVGWMSE